MPHSRLVLAMCLAAALLTVPLSAQQPAGPAPTPTTAVLVNLTVKPNVDRAQLMKVLPDEVRATVKLYLEGTIQQWYSRSDGRGVMFILNERDVAAAKAAMEQLPLSKGGFADLEFTALGPLAPLRVLTMPPSGAQDNR